MLVQRAYNQGIFLAPEVSSSRLIHFAPLFTTILLTFLFFKYYLFFQILAMIYFFACYLFSYLEIKNFHLSLLGLLLFPSVHVAYMIGNVWGIVHRICGLIWLRRRL